MDFLNDFVQATDHLPSPRVFRWWAGVACVASVLGRDTYTALIKNEPLYPNHFIVLVADAAGGKSWAINKAMKLMHGFGQVAFSGDAPTPEALNKKMGGKGGWFDGSDDAKGRSFNLLAPEITTLLPDPEQRWWFQELAVLWDCPEVFERPTKTQGVDVIQNPYVNLLAGAQPYFFAEGLPKNINELGLPSRMIYVFSDEEFEIDYDAQPDEAAMARAYKNLARIARVNKYCPMEPEAMEAFKAWERGGRLPSVPGVGLSKAYSTRRNMHLGKLALIVAMSRHPERTVITREDLEIAMAELFATEKEMHKAMALAGGNAYLPKERAVVQFVVEQYERSHKPVSEGDVRGMAARFFTPNMRTTVIDDLVAQKLLRRVVGGFIPGGNA